MRFYCVHNHGQQSVWHLVGAQKVSVVKLHIKRTSDLLTAWFVYGQLGVLCLELCLVLNNLLEHDLTFVHRTCLFKTVHDLSKQELLFGKPLTSSASLTQQELSLEGISADVESMCFYFYLWRKKYSCVWIQFLGGWLWQLLFFINSINQRWWESTGWLWQGGQR